MDVCKDWTKCTVSGNTVKSLEVVTALNSGDWVALVDGIHNSKVIESIAFCNGTMSVEGVRLLSKVLQTHKSLVKLGLRGTNQNAESVKSLIESISEFAQSSAFVEAIEAALEGIPPSASSCGIQVLDLSDNPLGDEGVWALATVLKKTHISDLSMDSVGLTTEGFKRLVAEMPKGIQGTTIRSQKVVTKMPFALQSLSLNSNAPGLEGIKAIADFLSLNTTITSLSLKNCQLGDTSVGYMTKSLGSTSLSRLSQLDLSDNQIGASGADSLIALLRTNHLLVHVNLHGNPIPEDKLNTLHSLTSYNQRLIDARQMTPWKSEASITILNEDGTPVGVTCATVLSNGLVFIGSSYGDVYVWNPLAEETPGSGRLSRSNLAGSASTASQFLSGSTGNALSRVRASVASIDPSFLRSGKIETKIITYEPESRPTKRRINALIDNQDGTIWCVTDERAITIVNIQDRSVQKRLPLHKYQAISISKFGTDIYLGGATGEVSLWRSDSLACRHEIVLDGRYPISAIHSDGEYIYVGVLVHPARAGHILIFSQAMELVQHFEAHSEFVSSIVSYNDTIITSSWDKLIKVWSIDKSTAAVSLLHTLDGHHDKVTSLVVYNDKAISCSDDNTLIVWNLPPPSQTSSTSSSPQPQTQTSSSPSSASSSAAAPTPDSSSPNSNTDESSSPTNSAPSTASPLSPTTPPNHAAPTLEKRMLGAWGGSIYSLFAAHDKLVSCSHKEGRVTLWSLK
jgi:hypothetical protein